MMMLWLVHTLKAILFTTLSLLQRLICCGRKKARHASQSLPKFNPRGSGSQGGDLDDWNRWEEDPEIVIGTPKKPETVQDHIAAYRESLQDARKQRQQSEPNEAPPPPEEDSLFAELEPTVVKQKKVYIGPSIARGSSTSGRKNSRLAVQEDMTDPIMAMGDELAEWGSTAGSNSGWQPEDDDLSEVLRETRKEQSRR
ncbi:receptor-binding cancer antigen expressed on SiSo cells-like isoform X2 [Tigriopus californicus]|nr:receptor-binding cancer antigen expressed on SiSo cells-like isoform X2 [Tigriopus californicus]